MITEELKQILINTAKKEFPKEMCGILFLDEDNIVKFKQCDNLSDNPIELFEIDSTVLIDYNVIAIVHSHTNGRNYLSKCDMQNQRLLNLDWVLVCDDNVMIYRSIAPLLGRPFEFNKQDCYNLFKDCYMLAGIDFPEFKYPDNWYEQGMNLYVDNLLKYGFEKVDTPEIGDVILFTIGSEIANHAGVYIDNQLFIHHSIDRLSKRDILGGYWLKNTHSIWRYKWKSQLNFTAILENLETNLN